MINAGTQTEETNLYPLTSTLVRENLDDGDDHSSDMNPQYDSSWCMEDDDDDIDCESSEVEECQEASHYDCTDSK